MSAKLISIEDARSRVLAEASPLPAETVPLSEALGSVLAEDIIASHSVPPFDNSGMDGYAVRAVDLVDAASGSPGEAPYRRDHPRGSRGHEESGAGRGGQDNDRCSPAPGRRHRGAVRDHVRGRRVRPCLRTGQAGQEHPAGGRRRSSGRSGACRGHRAGARGDRRACEPGPRPGARPPAAPCGHHLHRQRTGRGRPAARSRADPQLEQLLAAGAVPAIGRGSHAFRYRPRRLRGHPPGDPGRARVRRAAHVRRSLGRQVRLRQGRAGRTRRRATVVGRGDETGQAPGVRSARRHACLWSPREPGVGHGVVRAVRQDRPCFD